MGTIILVIAVVIEIAFAVYCLVTKSRRDRLRNYIALGAFAAFVLFALASIIQWSFRWYLLGGLLLFWAVIGAWRLLRNKTETKTFSPVRTVLNAVGVLLLVFIAVTPALLFPQFTLPEPTGEYEVTTASFTYTDESRIETFTDTGEYRTINVKFWYPKDTEGTYPLVVFSHGTGGIKISNTSTFMDLASNGYVVCSIDHPYHSQFTIGEDGKFVRMNQSYWQQYLDVVNDKYDEATSFQLHHEWIDLRAADMNFALDTILELTQGGGSADVYRMVDPAKIGLIGHSLGGEAAALVARQRNDVGAVVNLEADLSGEYLEVVDGREILNDQPYSIPILTILADSMAHLIDAAQNPDEVALNHILASNPNAFVVHLTGTNHFSVTDLPLVSPFFVSMMTSAVPGAGGGGADPYETIDKMNGIVLQFLDVYLKGEGSFSVAPVQ